MEPELPSELAAALRGLSADLQAALAELTMPVFVLDRDGYVRWLNAAAIRLFGDRRGEHYGVVVAAEAKRTTGEQFASKVVGGARTTRYETVVIDRDGTRLVADVDSVRLEDQGRVVGVFGVIEVVQPAREHESGKVRLTPRQLEVLRLVASGFSTDHIAGRLQISHETVRNHVRHVLRALGAHSRVEAVARARALGII